MFVLVRVSDMVCEHEGVTVGVGVPLHVLEPLVEGDCVVDGDSEELGVATPLGVALWDPVPVIERVGDGV